VFDKTNYPKLRWKWANGVLTEPIAVGHGCVSKGKDGWMGGFCGFVVSDLGFYYYLVEVSDSIN
jgi:hypothetical protein